MSSGDIGRFQPAAADFARVEAVGEPGQRRFRLIVGHDGGTTIVWMEKQQLDALGRAIEQMLTQLASPLAAGTIDDLSCFDLETSDQFRVGKLEIGFEEETSGIVLITYDIEAAEDAVPRFVVRLDQSKALALSEEAAIVVAAGRPRCVLCGRPMGPGPHACANQNGHLQDDLIVEGDL